MKAYRIRLEYGKTNPEAVCILRGARPAISWAVAARAEESQAAYRLAVTHGDDPSWWDTGWIKGKAQSAVYDGRPLVPGEVYSLHVRVKDEQGNESEPAVQPLCLGSLPEWTAPWIARPGDPVDGVISFIKDFQLGRRPVSACLFVCGLGYHRVTLNGRAVLDHPMNPALSEYEKRCYYAVLPGLQDILHPGGNRIGIQVAAGWRTPSNVCYELTKRIPDYTGPTEMTAALRLRYADGGEEWLYSDGTWQCVFDPITYTNIFMGERYEAGLAQSDTYLPGTALTDAQPAVLCDAPGGVMEPDTLEPVMPQEAYPAVTVSEVAPGIFGVDFGQNLAGVCRIRIPQGIEKGGVISLSHAEVLGEDGRLYLPPLRKAASEDRYTAAGDGKDPAWWQPAFTYHGFRYAEVKGYPVPLCKEDIQAVSLYTDIATGSGFRCGNALVNAIEHAAMQTEKANLHSILTDCPQRDERMAWMNDATVRFEETPYRFDIGRLFPKVVRDCMDVQDDRGAITCTAPFAFGSRPADPVCTSYLMAGWQAYLHTGNAEILREGYDGFKAWNDFLLSKSEGYIVQYSYYGDWASPAYACEGEDGARSKVTPGILMSTGYCYCNATLLCQMAELLGMPVEAARQRKIAANVRQAFLDKWWNAQTGIVGTGSQACQSFALWLDILPEEGRQMAADRLHEDLVASAYRFTTGNLCTRYMMDVLARFGYLEDAWTLITREEYPSFGFMLQQEATTIWERFELKKNPGMNSHNHPMYGAVAYWFYAYLAGIAPVEGGWRTFSVKPTIPEGLSSASAQVETPYGDVSVRWVKRYGGLHLYVNVPHGTRAIVALPGDGGQYTVAAGFHQWHQPL